MTRTRYEIIKEGFEVRKDVPATASDIFDALFEDGIKNGSYEAIGYADTLAEAREVMANNPSFVKDESAFPSWIKSGYLVYAEEQELIDDEWEATGSYEASPVTE